MGKEAACSLEEAKFLISRLKDPGSSKATPCKIELEGVSRRLLLRFNKTADTRCFNAFYGLTKEMFHSYAYHHIRRYNRCISPEDIVHKLYILILEKALSPHETPPWDYLFPWCYRVIKNMVSEESRRCSRTKPLVECMAANRPEGSQLDSFIEKEEETGKKKKLEKIMNILHSSEAGMSGRDRKIMRLFYLEGLSIKEISSKMCINTAHVGVILMRSRNRIAARLKADT